MNRKKMIAVSIVLSLILIIGGMLAYFTDTDTATNVFTLGDDVEISIEETGWTEGNNNLWSNSSAQGIHPGVTVAKAPVITNDSLTTPAYVFAQVIVPCYDSDADGDADLPLFSLNNIGSGWTLISTSAVDTSAKTITYIYAYGTGSSLTSLAASQETVASKTTAVFSSVTLDPDLTAVQSATANNNPNIIVNAYGIQTDGVSSDPATVWALFNV